MSDALFDDDDDDDAARAQSTAFLVVGAVATSGEALGARENAMRQHPDYRNATRIVFEEDDQFTNAAEFQAAMGLVRLPTMEEASGWLAEKRAFVETAVAGAGHQSPSRRPGLHHGTAADGY
jgi:hypothetical protein